MEFEHSEKVRALQARVEAFMAEHIYPNEEELFAQVSEGERGQPVQLLETLKVKVRSAELWNRRRVDEPRVCAALRDHRTLPLGREVFNCSARDTGSGTSVDHQVRVPRGYPRGVPGGITVRRVVGPFLSSPRSFRRRRQIRGLVSS